MRITFNRPIAEITRASNPRGLTSRRAMRGVLLNHLRVLRMAGLLKRRTPAAPFI